MDSGVVSEYRTTCLLHCASILSLDDPAPSTNAPEYPYSTPAHSDYPGSGMGLGRRLRSVKSLGRLSSSNRSTTAFNGQLESPFPPLLVTNLPPTETQAYHIKQAIAGAETLLSSLEYHGCLKECEKTIEFIQLHKNTLSVVRHVPPEILQEIFLWLVPTGPHSSLPARYWITPSQVCRPWRAAAFAAPELWSYLPSIRLSSRKTEEAHYVASLNEYLSRSHSVPIHVQIDAPFREYASTSAHLALDALVNHTERWVSLQVDTAFQTYQTCFTPLGFQGRFTSLKYLHLDIWRIYSFSEPLTAFQNAPKLEQVSVAGAYPHSIVLPWAQIKRYKEKVQNHGGLQTVLTQAVNLQRLEVTRTTECVLEGPVELPRLKTLYMRYDGVQQPDGSLMHLVLPVLEDLQIVGGHGELVPCLATMLRKSRDARRRLGLDDTELSCLPLRRLAFRTKTIPPGSLCSILRLTPLLEELDIPHPPMFDAENLVCNPDPQALLPTVASKLRRLFIHSDGEWGNEETYKRIAQSRCEQPVDALRSPQRLQAQRLDSFRLVFENPALVMTQQSALEGWFHPSSSDPTYKALLQAKADLMHEIPDLAGRTPLLGRSIMGALSGSTSAAMKRLDSIMRELNGLVVTDVHHIYRSELHFALRRIAGLSVEKHHPLADEKNKLRERAAAILTQWKPLFEADVKNNFRWVRIGRNSLVYIPSHNACRQGPNGLDAVLYGLKDEMHDYDLFWYRHM